MARLFLTNIDLKGNQLVNVVLHNNSSASGLSTAVGSMYYDTTSNKFTFRQGSTAAWVSYLLDTTTLATIAAPTGSVSLNNQKITSLSDPTSAQDAANKRYVDAAVAGIDWKNSVRVATTGTLISTFTNGGGATTLTYANNSPGTTPSTITLTTVTTSNWTNTAIDSLATNLVVNDRILVKNEATGAHNGIYRVTQIGTLVNNTPFIFTRAADADQDGDLSGGTAVWVEDGTTNGDTGWVISSDVSIVIGTTSSTWTQFSGAGQITAGDGLTKSGNTINFVGATLSGLTIDENDVAVNPAQLWIGSSNVVLAASAPTAQDLTGISNITGGQANMTVRPATRASGVGFQMIVTGGIASGGVGGALSLVGGAGTSANGGQVFIDGGAGTAVGAVNVGTFSSTINIGQTSVSTTVISGTTRLSALANGFVKTTSSNGTLEIDTTVALTTNKLSVFAATTSTELAGVISDETGSGALVFGTAPTISLPTINNIRIGYTTTATSGTAQVLDVNANYLRYYTGSTAQTVTLPVTSTLALGHSYEFHNNSTAVLTIQSSGLNTVVTVPPSTTVHLVCILTSGTTAASWDFDFTGSSSVPIRKVAGTIALTGGTPAAITHNLATRDVTVQMWETSSNLPTQVVEMDVVNTSTTQVTVTSSLMGTYYYVIMG